MWFVFLFIVIDISFHFLFSFKDSFTFAGDFVLYGGRGSYIYFRREYHRLRTVSFFWPAPKETKNAPLKGGMLGVRLLLTYYRSATI